ncbi:MFS transporter [Weissella cibaria]|uniref:MFS transporter n=1 Tax=Weissella cibaria TaxID=137591 RepID=UPI0039A6381E
MNEQPISRQFFLMYALAFVGVWMAFIAPTMSGLQIRIGQIDPAHKASGLALVLGVGALLALVSNPIWGQLSDRHMGRWGRRKPFMFFGGLAGTVALFVLPLMQTVVGVVIAWSVVQLVFNAAIAALHAITSDMFPESERGKASVAVGVGGGVGTVLGIGLSAALVKTPILMFGVPALLGFIILLIFLVWYQDTPLQEAPVRTGVLKTVLDSYSFNWRKTPDFGKLLTGNFFILIGLNIITTYQVYVMSDRLGWSDAKVASMITVIYLISGASSMVANYIAGWLSDKYARYRGWIVGSALLLAGTATMFGFRPDLLILAAVLAGLAQGAENNVAYAALSLTMPDQENGGKWLGIGNMSMVLPQSIAPAVAPILLAIGNQSVNYVSLYLGAAIIAVIGAGVIMTIKKLQ